MNNLNRIIHDCRLAARHLRIAWPFALAAVATLALGIGANVTLFSLADSVMFRPLPLRHADRLVIAGEGQTDTRSEVSYLNFRDWQARSRAFDSLAAMGSSDWPVTLVDGEPVSVAHRAVSGEFFATLGVQAAFGRTIATGDDQRGAPRTLVISHGLWQRRFGGDPAIVGRAVALDDGPFTIVGVMPRGFTYPFGTDAWSALVPALAGIGRPELPDFLATRDAAALHVVGPPQTGNRCGRCTRRSRPQRPLKGPIGLDSSWRIEGQLTDAAERNPWVNLETITPGYFRTLDTPLLDGRAVDDRDRDTTQPVVVVNEKLARWAWPGQPAVGKRLRVAALDEWTTVVGVVADVRYRELASARFDVYVSYRQSPFAAGDVLVRAGPGASVPQIRDRLRAINPRGVIGITRMADLVAIHQMPWKANLALFGIFAWLTVLLAVVGLYAQLASTVEERSREIGVRLALGAGPRRIVALVLGDGARIALLGAGAGLLAALAGGRLIRALLFETSSFDVAALVAAPLALVTVALIACALPALRAASVDPAISLRAE